MASVASFSRATYFVPMLSFKTITSPRILPLRERAHHPARSPRTAALRLPGLFALQSRPPHTPKGCTCGPPEPKPRGPQAAHKSEATWPPTVRAQLDFFAGSWRVHDPDAEGPLTSTWRGAWLFVTHPAGPDGRRARYADIFSEENQSYVRYDRGSNRQPMFISAGWLDGRWEWQRADGSGRITYEKLDEDTLFVTEETRAPEAYDKPYQTVRQFEARRQK